jgi:hypothetical protein
VECRGCSEGLQRVITDFGADDPFVGAVAKLREHYGIEIPVSTVRVVTEKHGAGILERHSQPSEWPKQAGVATLVAQMDGSMLPVVETANSAPGAAPVDRRKTRRLSWKEVRLCLAHEPGRENPVYFGATTGSVNDAGEQWKECTIVAGAGKKTRFHGLGDGAVWITEQMDLTFGAQGQYLLDFYHLCDYLAAAAERVAGSDKASWMEEQKTRLKENRCQEVLQSLDPFLEGAHVPEPDAPVRACYRYIENRLDFLDYKGAIAANLPIGSGEIESAHRYVFQKRLKISGAWWTLENLGKMVSLRVVRANQAWEDYWFGISQKPV